IGISLKNADASGPYVDFKDTAGVDRGALFYDQNWGAYYLASGSVDLVFQTNTNPGSFERMRIVGANGNIGVGVNSPQAAFDIASTGTSSAIIIPRDINANRPTGVNGMMRYNTSTSKFEVYANTAWTVIATNTTGTAGDFMANGSVAMTGNL